MSERGNPIIVSSFEYEGRDYEVVLWLSDEEEDTGSEWDVVAADMPYVWRQHAALYEGAW
jgi:hypothetical protein